MFYSVALTRMCLRWEGLDMLRDVFSFNMMMLAMPSSYQGEKSDSMIMRMLLKAARAIHRRHKSSLLSVCKPSKEVSFKFFFSKVFFYLPVVFLPFFFVKWERSLLSLLCHLFFALIMFQMEKSIREVKLL